MKVEHLRSVAIAISGILVGKYMIMVHPIAGVTVAALIGFYLWTEQR